MDYLLILALLKAKFSGVRKDGLTQLARSMALQCATEDEARKLVEKLTDAQVNEFVKEFRSVVDTEVSSSNKTLESNLRKKYNITDKPNVEPGNDGGKGNDNDNADIAELIKKAVADAVAPFQTELAGYKANEVAKTRLQRLTEKLESCKDATFKAQTLKDFARMRFETDQEFDEYLTEKETDIAQANQTLADSALSNSGGGPLFAQTDENGVSKGVVDYLNSLKPESNPFSGKEV